MIVEKLGAATSAPLYLWDRRTGALRSLHVRSVEGIAIGTYVSDDGRTFSYACADGVICVRRVGGAVIRRLSCRGRLSEVLYFYASSNFRTLFFACERAYVEPKATVIRTGSRRGSVTTVAGRPEGLSGDGRTLFLGRKGARFADRDGRLQRLRDVVETVSRNGRFVLSQSGESPLFIRDVIGGTERVVPTTRRVPQFGTAISDDGRTVLAIQGASDPVECMVGCPRSIVSIDAVTGASTEVATTANAFSTIVADGGLTTVVFTAFVLPVVNGSNPAGESLSVLTAI
jgi:hypothetical protein